MQRGEHTGTPIVVTLSRNREDLDVILSQDFVQLKRLQHADRQHFSN